LYKSAASLEQALPVFYQCMQLFLGACILLLVDAQLVFFLVSVRSCSP
jgi:hypothetical protein